MVINLVHSTRSLSILSHFFTNKWKFLPHHFFPLLYIFLCFCLAANLWPNCYCRRPATIEGMRNGNWADPRRKLCFNRHTECEPKSCFFFCWTFDFSFVAVRWYNFSFRVFQNKKKSPVEIMKIRHTKNAMTKKNEVEVKRIKKTCWSVQFSFILWFMTRYDRKSTKYGVGMKWNNNTWEWTKQWVVTFRLENRRP